MNQWLALFISALIIGGSIALIVIYVKKLYIKNNRSVLNNIQIGNNVQNK